MLCQSSSISSNFSSGLSFDRSMAGLVTAQACPVPTGRASANLRAQRNAGDDGEDSPKRAAGPEGEPAARGFTSPLRPSVSGSMAGPFSHRRFLGQRERRVAPQQHGAYQPQARGALPLAVLFETTMLRIQQRAADSSRAATQLFARSFVRLRNYTSTALGSARLPSHAFARVRSLGSRIALQSCTGLCVLRPDALLPEAGQTPRVAHQVTLMPEVHGGRKGGVTSARCRTRRSPAPARCCGCCGPARRERTCSRSPWRSRRRRRGRR